MNASYQEPLKNKAREFALTSAITALTAERQNSAIVRADEFTDVIKYGIAFLEKHNILPKNFKVNLLQYTKAWHIVHSNSVGTKKPSELRVLYLCGPEPQNDLKVLISEGIIPQNIWAVESHGSTYESAVEQLKQNGIYIKIHHGNLEGFLDSTNETFDIIYIDACGPLPSTQPNTLRSCASMFYRERLSSIGALITNFSQPPIEKQSQYERLLAYYFAPRQRDCPNGILQAGADPALADGDPDYLIPFIKENFDECYSDFITRFLVDLGREITPYARAYDNKDNRIKYFSSGEKFKREIEKSTKEPTNFDELFSGNTAITSNYPVLAFLNYIARDKELNSFLQPLISANLQNGNIKSAFQNTVLLSQVLEGHWDMASDQMLRAVAQSWFDAEERFFCDVPLPHLIINSLIGIFGHPYFPNPRQSSRFSYTAKETKMYMDLTIFDQCRYYFDFLPTIDLVPEQFKSSEYQMILRSCLDRIGRHDFESSSHPFRGSSIGCFNEFRSAKAYDFAIRLDSPPIRRNNRKPKAK